jgi:tetraacyldisaccharide 4'-kinase
MTRPLLWPLVPVYRFGLALRDFQLRSGLKRIHRLQWPVISIGNLSTGGSGKTPLAITLAKALTVRGLYVDVLSRGYGRHSAFPLLVDRDGIADDFGDEPLEISRVTGVPVYVAAERYQAGQLAEAASGAPQDLVQNNRLKAHILDDGFQHRQLARDLDILLLSRRDLADHLLPAGNLREPLLAAERAHIIAIPADEPEVAERTTSPGWRGAVWRLHRRLQVQPIDGPVVAFCGIARPDQFFHGLESAGIQIASRVAFTDHHRYTARDLERLLSAARTSGAAALLTTEKDRVRLGSLAASLPGSLPVQTAQLSIEIENQEAAVDSLIDCLKGALTSATKLP